MSEFNGTDVQVLGILLYLVFTGTGLFAAIASTKSKKKIPYPKIIYYPIFFSIFHVLTNFLVLGYSRTFHLTDAIIKVALMALPLSFTIVLIAREFHDREKGQFQFATSLAAVHVAIFLFLFPLILAFNEILDHSQVKETTASITEKYEGLRIRPAVKGRGYQFVTGYIFRIEDLSPSKYLPLKTSIRLDVKKETYDFAREKVSRAIVLHQSGYFGLEWGQFKQLAPEIRD